MCDNNENIPIVVDLGIKRRGELNESFLEMFGGAVEMILKRMFGKSDSMVTIRGNNREISSFANTLSKEKKYMDSYIRHGLDNPNVMRNKSELNSAINGFERETGIKWPIKE